MIPISNKKSSRRFPPASSGLLVPLFLFALLSAPLKQLPARNGPDPSNPGRGEFEQAYALEKSEPERAARLYEEALKLGLDKKLRSAALWRLFYIYREQKDYAGALLVSEQLGSPGKLKKVLEDLREDMRREWDLSEEAARYFEEGLRLLKADKTTPQSSPPTAPSGETEEPDEDLPKFPKQYLTSFYRAIDEEPKNIPFRMEILNRLVRSGKSREALLLLDAIQENHVDREPPAADRLAKADLLLSIRQKNEAKEILVGLSRDEEDLEKAHKFRILYLLGRIYRDEGDMKRAVTYFRMSVPYAEESGAARQLALASYALYKRGMALQALALLRKLPESGDPNVHLLRLVLRAEVDENEEAIQELLERKEEFVAEMKAKRPSFLGKRALRIISRYK